MSGRLIGVGVGPGDPELITLKAVRAIASADVIAHFAKAGRSGNARATIEGHVPANAEELKLSYPLTTELAKTEPGYQQALRGFYDEAAQSIAARLDRGCVVAVISEGDPLFYGSYMHLHVRLARRYPTEIVAGVTGMSGCWSAAQLPIAQGDDVFAVLPATLSEAELTRRLTESDATVIMKLGRHLPKVRRALAQTGLIGRAFYVERGTMSGALSMPLIEMTDDTAPYFALVLVPGWDRQP